MTDESNPIATSAAAVDGAVERSLAVLPRLAALPIPDLAELLEAIGETIRQHSAELVELAVEESHLSEGRLAGEVVRTAFQFDFFADQVRLGAVAQPTIDHADVDWLPAPRPDLRSVAGPIGPVLVFEASNFPLAFGAAGTDTASALAAACPVLVKAHPAHPRLTAMTARLLREVLHRWSLRDAFDIIIGDEAGRQALLHPEIAAASFTGSLRGGRALFDLAVSRPTPIPFYAEMGSVNPVFVTERAMRERGESIWAGHLASFSGSAGQLCTKPGLIVVPSWAVAGASDDEQLDELPGSVLLTDSITAAYRAGLEDRLAIAGVRAIARSRHIDGPVLLAVSATVALAAHEPLLEECFGPVSVVIGYESEDELLSVVAAIEGQLTATVHASEHDPIVERLVPQLARRAGRVLMNEWPTGVSVTYAMQHGGPYPATTSTTTSVGARAVDRFTRTVSYQNMPDHLLPPALQESNPLALDRRTDGSWRTHNRSESGVLR